MKKLRVAVTGLRRAGKTVFLTSLINHLLEGNEETLPAFGDSAITFTGSALPQKPGGNAFPYHRYVEELRGAEPTWPERTSDMTEFRLSLDLRNLRERRTRTVELELVDYPGERLLDLPMLSKSYREWSDDVLRDAEVGVRKDLAKAWLAECDALGSERRGQDGAAAVREYSAYLHECRERGLTYLQPSAMLLNGDDAERAPSDFCPLTYTASRKAHKLAHRFASRYDAYVRDYVRPFFKAVGRCSRQVVLVDVMRVLRQGVHSYNDTRQCLRAVLDAYGYVEQRGRFSVRRLLDLLNPKVERVIFAATKADQCTRATRGNLRYLLEELIDPKRRQLIATLPHGRMKITFCAAHRSTDDAAKEYEGRELSCLRGVRADRPPDKEGPWFPGELPMEWPEDDWNPQERQFTFPDFLPRRLPMRDGALFPHINLDKVFWHVVEDLIL